MCWLLLFEIYWVVKSVERDHRSADAITGRCCIDTVQANRGRTLMMILQQPQTKPSKRPPRHVLLMMTTMKMMTTMQMMQTMSA